MTVLLLKFLCKFFFLPIKLYDVVSVYTLFHISVDHAGIIPLLFVLLTDKFGNQGNHPSGNRNDHYRNQSQPPVNRKHHHQHTHKLENTVNGICSR